MGIWSYFLLHSYLFRIVPQDLYWDLKWNIWIRLFFISYIFRWKERRKREKRKTNNRKMFLAKRWKDFEKTRFGIGIEFSNGGRARKKKLFFFFSFIFLILAILKPKSQYRTRTVYTPNILYSIYRESDLSIWDELKLMFEVGSFLLFSFFSFLVVKLNLWFNRGFISLSSSSSSSVDVWQRFLFTFSIIISCLYVHIHTCIWYNPENPCSHITFLWLYVAVCLTNKFNKNWI